MHTPLLAAPSTLSHNPYSLPITRQRFYFLATTYLLDILSNGNRPWVVAGHVNNILQGVKSLTLTGEPKINLTEFIANEAEVMDTKLTGPLKLEGKVEYYLGHVIDKVRDELLAKTGAAIKDYNTTGLKSKGASRLRSEWLSDHLGQLCIAWMSHQSGIGRKRCGGCDGCVRWRERRLKQRLKPKHSRSRKRSRDLDAWATVATPSERKQLRKRIKASKQQAPLRMPLRIGRRSVIDQNPFRRSLPRRTSRKSSESLNGSA